MCHVRSSSLSLLALRTGNSSVTCEVRNYAQQALDNHKLTAMVHFVFFGAEQHLKPGFRPPWRVYLLPENIFWKRLYESAPAFSFLAKGGQDLVFGEFAFFLNRI